MINKDDKISNYFTWGEMLVTNTGLPNDPHGYEQNLGKLATSTLDKIREQFGPMRITSAFRSSAVNTKVGGAPRSLHTMGRAADFVFIDPNINMIEVCEWIKENLVFDELILERWDDTTKKAGWIHIGINMHKTGNKGNMKVMTMRQVGKTKKYTTGLPPR